MSDLPPNVDHLLDLAGAVCNKSASEDDLVELDSILLADGASRRRYVDYCRIHVALRLELRAHQATQKVHRQIEIESVAPPPSEFDVISGGTPSGMPLGFLTTTIHGTAGFFSSGWPVAYLAATVIFGIALLIGSHVYVSEPEQIVRQSVPLPSPLSPLPTVVGRITGMVDCRWDEGSGFRVQGLGAENLQSLIPNPQSLVARGDKFALASGLVEITYDTGARVILQGPVTYEVESSVGGYLSIGKLTAKLEKKVASGQWSVVSKSNIQHPTSNISNPQSPIPNPSLSTLHSPLFTIRTPTATVTDLGTEFGVQVDKQGHTTSHVFRGSVRFQLLGNAGKKVDAIVLSENETARTEKNQDAGGPCIIVRRASVDPQTFVRRVVRTIKMLDLLDIVAGGLGTTHRREHGIDASTGMQDPVFVTLERPGDGKYHRVTWHKLIDGTFVPNGKDGPVVLDSAGHTFDGFPRTAGLVYGSIWARPAVVKPTDDRVNDGGYYLYHSRGEQYMPDHRGLLCMHANGGITLNLEAMRKMYPAVRPAHFHAVVGVAHEHALVDIWVFVDGRLKFKRIRLIENDGVVPVDVELAPDDRFLTLVSTDGGDGITHDWVLFGDAALDVVPEKEVNDKQP